MFMSLWRTLIPYYAMHVKMKSQGHVHIWGLHEPESATYHDVTIKSIQVSFQIGWLFVGPALCYPGSIVLP